MTEAAPTEAATQPPRASGYRALLKNRSYSAMWAAGIISESGDYIFDLAVMWIVLDLTQSAFYVGLVRIAYDLPVLLFTLVAGVYVDRWNRKHTMVWADLLRGLIVLIVPALVLFDLLGVWGVWSVLAVVFVVAVISQFFEPAAFAITPQIVPEAQLHVAASLNTMSRQITQFLGFAAGGFLIAALTPSGAVLYNSASFLISALVILSMVTVRKAAATGAAAAGSRPATALPTPTIQPRKTAWGDLRESFGYIRKSPFLRSLSALSFVLNFSFAPVAVLMPLYATRVLGGDVITYGVLNGAVAGGMILGAYFCGKLPIRHEVGHMLILGVLGLGGFMVTLALLHNLLSSLLLLVGFGIMTSFINVSETSMLQSTIPAHLLGRIETSQVFFAVLGMPPASLLAGLLGDAVDVPLIFLFAGLGSILVAAIGWTRPALREARY